MDTNFKIQAYALILLRSTGHPWVSTLSSFSICLNYIPVPFSCVFYGDLYPNPECYDADIARDLKLLIEARKRYAHGKIKDYFYDRNCIGFVRLGNSERPGCVTVISTKIRCVRSAIIYVSDIKSLSYSGSDAFHPSIRMYVGAVSILPKFQRNFIDELLTCLVYI